MDIVVVGHRDANLLQVALALRTPGSLSGLLYRW